MEFLTAIKCLYGTSTQNIIRTINSCIDLEDYKEILEKTKERSPFEYAIKNGQSFHFSCLIHTGFSFFTFRGTEFELFYDFAYEFLVLQKRVSDNDNKLGLHYGLIGKEISSSSNMIAKVVNFREKKWKLVDLKDEENAMKPLEIVGKIEAYTQVALSKSFEKKLYFIDEGGTVSLEEDDYVDTYDDNEEDSRIDFSNQWIEWYCKRFD